MDPEIADFARSYHAFTEAMSKALEADASELTPLGEHVRDFLGVDPNSIEPVSETSRPIRWSTSTWRWMPC